MSRSNGQLLDEALTAVIAVGEGPYQANREAVHALDIRNSAIEGREVLSNVLSGIDDLIRAMERLKNVSKGVVSNAVAAIR